MLKEVMIGVIIVCFLGGCTSKEENDTNQVIGET